MNIVARPQLPRVIVSPCVAVVTLVAGKQIAAAHLQVLDLVLEGGLNHGRVNPTAEEWRVSLQEADKAWYFLVVLQEAVSGPSAEGPTPVQDGLTVVGQTDILRVVYNQF